MLLYGSADARDRARALLENLPQVRRVDAKGGQLLLLLHSPITEREYLTLLEKRRQRLFSLPLTPVLCVFKERRSVFLIAKRSKVIKDKRNRLAVDVFQNFIHADAVAETDERKAHARALGAPRAADSVDVKLLLIRQVVG
ncbi:MAG: hypothetical protein ACLUHE_17360 [Christensenellales bacterium]